MLVKEKKIPKYIIEDIEISSDSNRCHCKLGLSCCI